jgi:hypothetical protein
MIAPDTIEIARRCVWKAQQIDAHNDRAYDSARSSGVHQDARKPQKPFGETAESKPVLDGSPGEFAKVLEYNRDDGENAAILSRVSDSEADQFASVMQTQSGRFFARCEAVLQSICRDETGQFETDEQTSKRISKENKLKRQAAIICEALETQGVIAFRADNWQLKIVGIHSHEITEIPGYRRICLNPFVANRLRLRVLNWLQYFAQGKEDSLRFWTFTSGVRCTTDELEDRITWLHGRISDLNAQPFMRKVGVRIILRATEFGSLENRNRKAKHTDRDETGGTIEKVNGRWMYHPHAHCIVWMSKGPLHPWAWKRLMRHVWRFWGCNWDEGRRIRDVREAVKYVVKPGDMVRLAVHDPAELARLHTVLYRKKLVQPMDELAAQMRAASIPGLRPALRWFGDEQRWTLIKDVNKNPMPNGSDGSGLYGQDGARPDFRAAFDDTMKPVTNTEMTVSAATRYFQRDHYGVKPNVPEVCRVVARCAPGYNSSGVKEPRVVVMGTFFDKDAVLSHPLVRRMVSATRGAYEQGVQQQAAERGGRLLGIQNARRWAAGIRVHTGTPTVRVSDPGPMLFDPDDVSDPELCATLAHSACEN